MRIMHLANYHPGASHGVASAVRTLASAEANFGLTVAIYSPRRLPTAADVREVERAYGIAYLGGLSAHHALENFKPDVVHVAYLFHPEHHRTIIEAANFGIPVVVSPHGALHPRELKKSPAKRLKKSAYMLLRERRLLTSAARIRCVTAAEVGRLPKWISQEKAVVIPNPVEVQELDKSLQVQPLSRSDAIRVGYLGRLDVRTKGLDVLVDGCEMAARKGAPVKLLLAGQYASEWDRKNLQDIVSRTRHVKIEFLGVLLGQAKQEFLRSLDLYIQLSRWELFGMSIMEAMLQDIPIAISSNCDLAKDLGESPLVSILEIRPDEVAKAIQKAATHTRREDGLGSRWVQSRYGPNRIARMMHSLYESLANDGE
jgi:glycosyltransferase involved in cell wall biosynthesis